MRRKKKRKYFKMMWDRIVNEIDLDELISKSGLTESEEGEVYLYRHATVVTTHTGFPFKKTYFTARIELKVEELVPKTTMDFMFPAVGVSRTMPGQASPEFKFPPSMMREDIVFPLKRKYPSKKIKAFWRNVK